MSRSDVGHEADRGSTLVEQLVVMVLLVGLGLIISTVTISLVRSTGEHSRRVDGLHEQQLAMEVLTRDLRAADPLVSTSPLSCEPGRQPSTSPTFPSCANELALDLTRQGLRWRVTYSLQSGALVRAQQQWTGSTWASATDTVLARGLRNGVVPGSPVFAVRDAAGQPAASLDGVSRVHVVLAGRDVRASARSAMTSEVTVRNRVSRSSG